MLEAALLELCNELITEIVFHVAAGKDLKALSLAHRVFTDLCQRRLFKTLRISQCNHKLPVAYDTLERQPHKAAYIRLLSVDLSSDIMEGFDPFVDTRFLSFIDIISKAQGSLRSIHLAQVDNADGRSTRRAMDCILTVNISQTLTSLSLSHCELPRAAISQCPLLKKLNLEEVRLIELAGAPGNSNSVPDRKPRLEILEYTAATDTVKAMLSTQGDETPTADLSKLQILGLTPEHEEDLAVAQAILDAAHDSLEELYLVDCTRDPSTFRPFSAQVFRF